MVHQTTRNRIGQFRLRAIVLLLLMGCSLGLAVVFETTVRFFVPVSDFFLQWDPVVGLKHIPNKSGRSVKRGIFDVPVQMNSQGFRDREHTREKPTATKRIVLLGDSFIEALQVPYEQSIPALLEQQLQGIGVKAETINLGVSGIGTARQYLFLREYGLSYEPDLVLLFFVGNDVSDNSKRLQGLPYVPYPVPNGDGSVARDASGRPRFTPFVDQSSRLGVVTDFLRKYSSAYRLIRGIIESSPRFNGVLYRLGLMSTSPERVNRLGAANFGYYELYRSEYKEAWAEAWALTESLLLAIRDLAEPNGVRFAVVLVPAAWEVYPKFWNDVLSRMPAMRNVSFDLEKPSRTLASFLVRNNIPVINLLPEFRRRATKLPPLYVAHDAHWTAAGHGLSADLLTSHVTALLQNPMPLASPQKIKGNGSP